MITLDDPRWHCCGNGDVTTNADDNDLHIKALCAQCGRYIKFISRADMDLAPRNGLYSSTTGIRPGTRSDVLAADNYACVLCGATGTPAAPLHAGHIIPARDGGTSDYNNLLTLCSPCNSGLGARPIPPQAVRAALRRRTT